MRGRCDEWLMRTRTGAVFQSLVANVCECCLSLCDRCGCISEGRCAVRLRGDRPATRTAHQTLGCSDISTTTHRHQANRTALEQSTLG